MARFVTGNSFSTGDQVTADTLNNAVNNAKVSTDSVDNSSVAVDGSGVLSVKTSTSTSDGVTFAKFQQVPANTVLVRDANSQGSISAKAVADTQILIGDGTGFTSAALSGDVTMTNAGAVTIANDAVTGDKISDSAALPDGVTATTQSASDNSTKVATTAFVKSGFTPSTYGGEESVTFPNGLIMKWGTKSCSGDGNTAVSFGQAFPTACVNVQCTHNLNIIVTNDAGVAAISVTTSGFTIRNGEGVAGNIFWQAIGY